MTEQPIPTVEYCDRHPSARAKSVNVTPSGGVLYFCGHCTIKLLPALLEAGVASEPLPGESLDWGRA